MSCSAPHAQHLTTSPLWAGAPHGSRKVLLAHQCPVLGTDPFHRGFLDHPAASPEALGGSPASLHWVLLPQRHTGAQAAHGPCPSSQLPTMFLVSANRLDLCSEPLNGARRAWTSAVPLSRLLSIRPPAGGLFSTGASAAPVAWQSPVTQSASPSADTSGDRSPSPSPGSALKAPPVLSPAPLDPSCALQPGGS